MKKLFLVFLLPVMVIAYSEGEFYKSHPFRGNTLPQELLLDASTPQVFLYNGKGVWDTGYEHLKMFLSEHNVSYKTVYAKDLIDGKLQSNLPNTLIMPGGQSWEYLAELGDQGAANIKNFVRSGGGYIGICAGAFYATSNREGGQTTGSYGIGLLEGTAYDGTSLHTTPFIEGMMDIPLMPVSLNAGFQSMNRIVMFGGPSFKYSEKESTDKKLEVLARFQVVGDPSMVLFQYGKGKVYLSGPHLEIEEDRTDWGQAFYDPESDWPLLERVLKTVSN